MFWDTHPRVQLSAKLGGQARKVHLSGAPVGGNWRCICLNCSELQSLLWEEKHLVNSTAPPSIIWPQWISLISILSLRPRLGRSGMTSSILSILGTNRIPWSHQNAPYPSFISKREAWVWEETFQGGKITAVSDLLCIQTKIPHFLKLHNNYGSVLLLMILFRKLIGKYILLISSNLWIKTNPACFPKQLDPAVSMATTKQTDSPISTVLGVM